MSPKLDLLIGAISWALAIGLIAAIIAQATK
jgi:hypothetical protein